MFHIVVNVRPVQAVSEDVFIRTVRPRRIVNCLIVPPRNILTYLLTNQDWEWEGIGMSILKNSRNGNKMAGV